MKTEETLKLVKEFSENISVPTSKFEDGLIFKGYTFDRETLTVFFKDGKLVYAIDDSIVSEYSKFSLEFLDDVLARLKRIYPESLHNRFFCLPKETFTTEDVIWFMIFKEISPYFLPWDDRLAALYSE